MDLFSPLVNVSNMVVTGVMKPPGVGVVILVNGSAGHIIAKRIGVMTSLD